MSFKIGGVLGKVSNNAKKSVNTIMGGGSKGVEELGSVLSGQKSGIGAMTNASIGSSYSSQSKPPEQIKSERAAAEADTAAKTAQNAEKGLDVNGVPMKPSYVQPNIKPISAMQLSPLANNGQNFTGIDQMRAIANGNNPWVAMAKNNQQLQQQGLLDTATRAQQGADAQARANMAMRGGIRGGAAERLARNSAWNQMQAGQNVYQQGALQRGNIDLQGEQMRQDTLGKLGTAEQGYANYAGDLGKANQTSDLYAQAHTQADNLQANQDQNTWNATNYGTQMQGYGAGQTADAILRSQQGWQPGVTATWDPTGLVGKYQKANRI